MTPYRIRKATLITYSGRRVELEFEGEFITEPLRKVKERILDEFCRMCRNNGDPFVGIEVKTEKLFRL